MSLLKGNRHCSPSQKRLLGGCMTTSSRTPPSLLKLTLESAVAHIHRVVSLQNVPDMIVLELFRKTLTAGKLTEAVLQMFLATGNESILGIVQSLRIRPVLKPILPTRCSDRSF